MLQLVYHRANSHKKGGRQIGAHNVDVFCELSPFGIRGEVPRDRCCDPFVPEGPQHVPTFTTPPSIFLVLLFPLLLRWKNLPFSLECSKIPFLVGGLFPFLFGSDPNSIWSSWTALSSPLPLLIAHLKPTCKDIFTKLQSKI